MTGKEAWEWIKPLIEFFRPQQRADTRLNEAYMITYAALMEYDERNRQDDEQ